LWGAFNQILMPQNADFDDEICPIIVIVSLSPIKEMDCGFFHYGLIDWSER